VATNLRCAIIVSIKRASIIEPLLRARSQRHTRRIDRESAAQDGAAESHRDTRAARKASASPFLPSIYLALTAFLMATLDS
jgi:hypothetical protein